MHITKQMLGDREVQEDSLLVFQSTYGRPSKDSGITYYLVADGMGGHRGGDIASQIAVEYFKKSILRQHQFGAADLLSALYDSNTQIRKEVISDATLRGMGTTLTVAVVDNNELTWLSVGDSPLLVYRDGEIKRLNEDHSMLPLLLKEVKTRSLSESYALNHVQRNQLRSVLTGQEIKLIDQGRLTISEGDIFILATDGIGVIAQEKIEALLDIHATDHLDELSSSIASEVDNVAVLAKDNTSFIIFTL